MTAAMSWRILATVPAFLIGLTQIGCARSVYRTEDFSNDPSMQGGYRVGQVFRLRVPTEIIPYDAGKPSERLTLLSLEQVKAFRSVDPSNTALRSPRADVPAGAVIRIEKLICSYTDEYTWNASNVTIDATGTLTWPGHSWTNVAAPVKLDQILFSVARYNGGSLTATCDLRPPDDELVERVDAAG
ncbi:MAG TPA: hypothetical protein VHT05_06220 [Candidatus Elarobacter sp.]|nr:hypothetical protein [Candidatus Elarobacter sp.]